MILKVGVGYAHPHRQKSNENAGSGCTLRILTLRFIVAILILENFVPYKRLLVSV